MCGKVSDLQNRIIFVTCHHQNDYILYDKSVDYIKSNIVFMNQQAFNFH